MRKYFCLIAAGLIALSPVSALAGPGPESLDQLEPGADEWQIEWLGNFGGDGEQRFEFLTGITNQLVIGGEIEFEGHREGLRFEETSGILMWRFTDPKEKPLGLGLMGELALDRSGRLSELAARWIIEIQNERWWLQGNAILRHSREDGKRGTGIAYSASVQRAVTGVWLGIEALGQAVRLAGDPELASEGSHYAGPSLTLERAMGADSEVEVGLAWLHRLKGEGAPSGPRVFIQYTF